MTSRGFGRIVNKEPPINLELSTIKFPITAIASILHRLSGLLLFILLPCILLTLNYSLLCPASFAKVQSVFHNPIVKIVLWLLLSSLFYHLVAGIRHLLMDADVGVTKTTGKITAAFVVSVSVIMFILIGIWLWV